VPTSEGYVTSDDCRLYFAAFGEGRPVLLLHGGMGNATNWANQIGALTGAGYRVVAMDTRGHGRSSEGKLPFSYRLFARDVGRLIERLGLKDAILAGWSDGACTALEFARTEPSLAAGVVFFACNVDPSGTVEFRMTEAIRNCLARHEADFAAMTPTLGRFEDLQPKLGPMQQNEPNYSREDLRGITVPTAVIQGDRDEFIKLDHARYIAASLPNARFELLEGLGHFAPIQKPARFNEVLLRCIARFA
jgi:pimeloyl-ACP methyl ester carboxylesterase